MIPTIESEGPLIAWATSDWHLGHKNQALHFEAHLAMALEVGAALIMPGDIMENTTTGSKPGRMGGVFEQDLEPQEQVRKSIDLLKKFRQGVYLPGNHDRRTWIGAQIDVFQLLSEAEVFAVKAMIEPGFFRVMAGSQTYHGYIHHGEGPVVNPLTLFQRLQAMREGIDLIVSGHVHQGTTNPVEVESPSGKRSVLWVRCGHYLEEPLYQRIRPLGVPGEPGSHILRFAADRRQITSTWLGRQSASTDLFGSRTRHDTGKTGRHTKTSTAPSTSRSSRAQKKGRAAS